jgi:hypothetical protein
MRLPRSRISLLLNGKDLRFDAFAEFQYFSTSQGGKTVRLNVFAEMRYSSTFQAEGLNVSMRLRHYRISLLLKGKDCTSRCV